MVADKRSSLQSTQKDFEGGVHLGIGGFNLVRECTVNTNNIKYGGHSLVLATFSVTELRMSPLVRINLYFFQVLSLLPPMIIKLLEWVGFSGDRVIPIDCVIV